MTEGSEGFKQPEPLTPEIIADLAKANSESGNAPNKRQTKKAQYGKDDMEEFDRADEELRYPVDIDIDKQITEHATPLTRLQTILDKLSSISQSEEDKIEKTNIENEIISIYQQEKMGWTNLFEITTLMGLTKDDLVKLATNEIPEDDLITASTLTWRQFPQETRNYLIKFQWNQLPRAERRAWGYYGPDAVSNVDKILGSKTKFTKLLARNHITEQQLINNMAQNSEAMNINPRLLLYGLFHAGVPGERLEQLTMSSLGLNELISLNEPKEIVIKSKNAEKNFKILKEKLDELNNVFDAWIEGEMSSGYTIKTLHSLLFRDDPEYRLKGISPTPPGQYRTSEVSIGEEGEEISLIRSTDVSPIMAKYTEHLDRYLEKEPSIYDENGNLKTGKELRDTIHESAWNAAAYHNIFIRIHPFLDGSGRIARMIQQRILKGAGLKGIDYLATYDAQERERYLNIMDVVAKEVDIRPLELYLLAHLRSSYDPSSSDEAPIANSIDELLKKLSIHFSTESPGIYEKITGKTVVSVPNPKERSMAMVWGIFKDLLDKHPENIEDLENNAPEDSSKQ